MKNARIIIKDFESPSDKAEFNDENTRSNIKSATVLFYVIIAFEILMIVRTLLTHATPFPDYVKRYMFCYIFLLSLSFITLGCVRLTMRIKKDCTRFVFIVTTIFEFGILLWSIAITTLDSYESERFIVYLTIVVCLTSLLKLRPWAFLSIELGGYVLLNIALFLYLNRFNSSSIINLTVFTVIFSIISISKYNSSVDEYYNKKKINILNEMLESEKNRYQMIAKIDQLTGLFSRNILTTDMKNRIPKSEKDGKATGMAMFDLDDFKRVNDTYGHAIGDECLRKIGKCFKAYPFLSVYRYGGEEFLAVCDELSETDFLNTIDAIIKNVSEFEFSEESLHITVSAGCVYGRPKSETCAEQMINAADNALYEAKKSGKNKYVKGKVNC